MPRGARLVKNTGILMGMELGSRLLDAVVSVILARYLAPQGFGLLAFALSFAWLFSILPGFGMGSLSIRDVARTPQQLNQYLTNGLIAKAALALVTFGLIGLVSWVMGFPADKYSIVLLAGLLMILETNVRYTLSFFQAGQRMTVVALVNLGVRVGWLVFSLAIVWLQGGVAELIGVRALVTAVGLLVSIVLINRQLQRIRWTFDLAFTWQILKASFPFALFRLKEQVYTDIDTVMLSAMRGDVMTGWYAAASKLIRLFRFIPTGVFGAILPAMSKLSRDAKADLAGPITRSCKYLMIVALPIAGGICVLADHLVLLLFGPAYSAAVPALRVLSWSLLFTFLNSLMTAAIAAVDRERRVSAYLIAGALFSGLSNLIVVPLFGHLGAAATSVLTEAMVFLLQVRLLRQVVPDLNLWGALGKPVGVTALMMLVAWLSREAGLAWTILGSAAVYVGCLVATRTIGPQEWSLLNGVLQVRAADERT